MSLKDKIILLECLLDRLSNEFEQLAANYYRLEHEYTKTEDDIYALKILYLCKTGKLFDES